MYAPQSGRRAADAQHAMVGVLQRHDHCWCTFSPTRSDSHDQQPTHYIVERRLALKAIMIGNALQAYLTYCCRCVLRSAEMRNAAVSGNKAYCTVGPMDCCCTP